MKKDCCPTTFESGCNVTVKVDVAKIVGCLCTAAVLIIAIIFGTKCYTKLFIAMKDEV